MTKERGVYPVILCGGSGTRLWPVSTRLQPKQFIPLLGSTSLFQETVERVASLADFRMLVVVAGTSHQTWVADQLRGFPFPSAVLFEPEGRDSAPAIAAAVAFVQAQDPDGIVAIVPCDHYIPDTDAFRNDMNRAVEAADKGGIVTLGITPTEPSTAYGYINPSDAKAKVSAVRAFVEKLDEATARLYIDEGYLWNSGNFIASVEVLTTAFENCDPTLLSYVKEALDTGSHRPAGLTLGRAFRTAPKISFDYAVMEKFPDRHVVRSTMDWSDLGAWDAVHKILPKDASNNSHRGDVTFVDATNCHVRATPGTQVVAAALDGLNIIAEEDVVFVTRLDRSQFVKTVADKAKAAPQSVDTRTHGETARAWRLWLETSVFPLWWANGFDHDVGIWRESLDERTGRPTGQNIRARVQGRQTYAFARAGIKGWSGPWADVVEYGFQSIDRHYATDTGLMRTLVDAGGNSINDDVLLYDQTFVLLALSACADHDPSAEERALTFLDRIETAFRHPGGARGFKETGDYPYQSNAQMHLFEAALAWTEADGSGRWRSLADEIASLARDHLIDKQSGFIREFYTTDWSPADGDDGSIVEPGHQFEWAWLLVRWATLSDDESWIAIARDLFEAGSQGIDPVRDVAVERLDPALTITSDKARLWPQTEWLKAALILEKVGSIPASSGHVERAINAVSRYFETPVLGLWFDKMADGSGFVDEPCPASSLYHIICAIEELEGCSE